jgi:phosphodiesterase/alkaline phosphatase D-like protein
VLVLPGHATATALTWWLLAEDDSTLDLQMGGGATDGLTVHSLPAGEELAPNHAYVVASTGLRPDEAHELTARTATGDLGVGRARTLPDALASKVPFTIVLGSCYNWPMDLDEVWRWLPPREHASESSNPLRLGFLLGDQIYMDLKKSIDAEKPTSWSEPLADAPNPWKAYLQQWRDPPTTAKRVYSH